MTKTTDSRGYDRWLDDLFAEAKLEAAPASEKLVTSPEENGADDPPRAVVAYMTRFFRQPESYMLRFPPEEIGEAIHFLAAAGQSEYPFSLLDRSVALDERLSCLLAIGDLYERCFAAMCTHYYCHLDWGPEPAGPVNGACYMFWDVFPFYPRSKQLDVEETELYKQIMEEARAQLSGELLQMGFEPAEFEKILAANAGDERPPTEDEIAEWLQLEDACLQVMERALALGHPACTESALHGLGHWHCGYPQRVEAIIDASPTRESTPELQAYAAAARRGAVL